MSTSIGTAVVGDPRLKKLRAMQMLELRLKSHTLQEIADEFRVSIDTVQRHLDWAVREGAIQKHEEAILERLVPKAIKAYEKALDNDTPDIFVAKDILGHLMKLSERVDKRQEHVEELTLNAWIKSRKATDVGRHGNTADAAREDSLRVAVHDEGPVPGHAPAGPAETGEASDREQLPAITASASREACEVGVHTVDGEVVGSEAGTAGTVRAH